MKNWLLAIRPKTLFASIAPVILGTTIAYYETTKFDPIIFVLTLVCALLLQVASNLANDYLDFAKGVDTIDRLGPVRVTSSGLISADAMKRALATTLFLAFILGIYLMWLGGPVIMIFGLLSLYFAYGYTGGPYPLSTNGLGELAAFVFFGLIAVTGTQYLQTKSFSGLGILLATGPGFISACILGINNLRDIKTDEEAEKRTLAVRWGEKFQRGLCLWTIVMSALSVVLAAFIFKLKWIWPVALLPLFFFQTWMAIFKGSIDGKLNSSLARTAQYNLLFCLLISIGLFMMKQYY